jgi:hypothetical protein
MNRMRRGIMTAAIAGSLLGGGALGATVFGAASSGAATKESAQREAEETASKVPTTYPKHLLDVGWACLHRQPASSS